MNKIATPDLSTVEVLDFAREKITVLNPVGYPPKVTKKRRRRGSTRSTARRLPGRLPLRRLGELLKQMQAWFAEHMPGVKTKLVADVERLQQGRSATCGGDQGAAATPPSSASAIEAPARRRSPCMR